MILKKGWCILNNEKNKMNIEDLPPFYFKGKYWKNIYHKELKNIMKNGSKVEKLELVNALAIHLVKYEDKLK